MKQRNCSISPLCLPNPFTDMIRVLVTFFSFSLFFPNLQHNLFICFLFCHMRLFYRRKLLEHNTDSIYLLRVKFLLRCLISVPAKPLLQFLYKIFIMISHQTIPAFLSPANLLYEMYYYTGTIY